MNTLVGKTLQGGKYTLEKELGRGGFGITYKATHHYLHQPVVIKTLSESFHLDPNFAKFVRQFQDEARRLALCVHPNIVRVSDFFLEAGWPYMVMEYICGPTLQAIAANNPLKEAVVLNYIRQLAEALKLVHQQGLLHRDIKPSNILLRQETDSVVLIDFGIAREFSPNVTQTHTNIVTEGFAPIEQYLRRAQFSPATDVYGLAATLYFLLTGETPTPAPLRERDPLPPPRELIPQISSAVNYAVLQGMAIEPSDRPATIDQWLSLLPNGINDLPSPTQSVATIPAILPPQQREIPLQRVGHRKLWFGGLVAIASGLSLSLGAIWTQLDRSVPASDPPETPQVSPLEENIPLKESPSPEFETNSSPSVEQSVPQSTPPQKTPKSIPQSQPTVDVTPQPQPTVEVSPQSETTVDVTPQPEAIQSPNSAETPNPQGLESGSEPEVAPFPSPTPIPEATLSPENDPSSTDSLELPPQPEPEIKNQPSETKVKQPETKIKPSPAQPQPTSQLEGTSENSGF